MILNSLDTSRFHMPPTTVCVSLKWSLSIIELQLLKGAGMLTYLIFIGIGKEFRVLDL